MTNKKTDRLQGGHLAACMRLAVNGPPLKDFHCKPPLEVSASLKTVGLVKSATRRTIYNVSQVYSVDNRFITKGSESAEEPDPEG